MAYLLLAAGFVLLIKGADYFVEGASSLARLLKIPALVIGLTIVAFGTSAPEASVSILSALGGQNGVALGNIIGSNIFNLMIVAGVAATISPLQVKRSMILKEFPFAILSSVVLLVLLADRLWESGRENMLGRGDGILLLLFFTIFMYYLVEVALTARETQPEALKGLSPVKSSLLTGGGLVGIIWGGSWVVEGATGVALTFGMSEKLVGLTIVAIGTSLPELVTSIVAARKGESELALGNVIGSNIFNVFFILGASTVLHPIWADTQFMVDGCLLLGATLLTYFFAVTKKYITRWEGGILVLAYMGYMVFIILRN